MTASEPGSYNVSGVSYGSQPVVALDMGQLGSIHANSIYMVGSSDGVGVNVAGKVKAVAGDLQISSSGEILLASGAELNAQNKLAVTWSGSIENNGEIRSNGDMKLSGISIVNNHVIHSADKLALKGMEIHNQASGSITSAKRITTVGFLKNEGVLIQNYQGASVNPAVVAEPIAVPAPVTELNIKHPVVAQEIVKPKVTVGLPAQAQTQAGNSPVTTQLGVQLNEKAVKAQAAMQSRMDETNNKMERKMNANMQKMNDAMAAAFSSNRF